MRARLDILGCGRLGRTLGHLLHRSGRVAIDGVVTQSLESAAEAVAFIGAGRALGRIAQLAPADVVLIAAPDDHIAACCDALAGSADLEGRVVFHCSGSLSSEVLAPARAAGASVASLHPVMSFADPARAAATFDGTACGCEGDGDALLRVRPLFEAIGARPFALDGSRKLLYHAGTVLASNALVALLETSLVCFERAGVERALASRIIEPLVGGTVDNVFARGSVAALTGPIARGDAALVERQLAALADADPPAADVYRALGRATVALARAQGGASTDSLDAIARTLSNDGVD